MRQARYLWALLSAQGMALLLAPDALLRWARCRRHRTAEVRRSLAVLVIGR